MEDFSVFIYEQELNIYNAAGDAVLAVAENPSGICWKCGKNQSENSKGGLCLRCLGLRHVAEFKARGPCIIGM